MSVSVRLFVFVFVIIRDCWGLRVAVRELALLVNMFRTEQNSVRLFLFCSVLFRTCSADRRKMHNTAVCCHVYVRGVSSTRNASKAPVLQKATHNPHPHVISLNDSAMHDDWLDDSAADTTGDAEWNRMERNFGSLGFQDGVGIGIENAVQGGFDEGFLQASRDGMAEGELYGIVRYSPARPRSGAHKPVFMHASGRLLSQRPRRLFRCYRRGVRRRPGCSRPASRAARTAQGRCANRAAARHQSHTAGDELDRLWVWEARRRGLLPARGGRWGGD